VKVFAVLADPTRRRIVEMLVSGEKSAGEIGARFKVSQPTVSKHLRVLRDAGLVRWRWEAQRRVYRLDARPLADIIRWLSRYREFFEAGDSPDGSQEPDGRGKGSSRST
jgi:DNA-binding transcriptional ArsR family regulator